MPEPYDSLFAHLAWADDRALDALRNAPTVQPALSLLAHVLGAERVWLTRLDGFPAEQVPSAWPTLTLDQCSALAHEVHQRFHEYLALLDDMALSATVHYRTSTGQEFDSAVRDILLHVALHGSYHRGQIATHLRGADATPVATDYILFTRGAQARSDARAVTATRLCQAIQERRLVRFTYSGGQRTVEPHLLGVNQQGHTSLSAWFVSGVSESGTGPGWRLYLVDTMSEVELLDEQFTAPRPQYNPDDVRMRQILCRIP